MGCFLLASRPNSAGTLRSESETQRKPEVPASPRYSEKGMEQILL